ncbi:MAG: YihY/virulence factor BrkB family protein [Planctomycetota bacterium]
MKMSGMWTEFENWAWVSGDVISVPKRFLLKVLRVSLLVVRCVVREKPMLRSAALTYTTTLSIVPLLAMVFGILSYVNVTGKYRQQILDKLATFMTSDAAAQIQGIIEQGVNNINGGGLAGVSLVLVLFGAMTLITNIEQAFNHIWGIEKMRPLKQRFMSYLTILVTGPLAIIILLTVLSVKNIEFLRSLPLLGPLIESSVAAVIPLCVASTFFSLLYYVMPNVQVRIPAAFAGGLVSGMLFEGNQVILGLFLSKFKTFNTIYGSLASIPIFLFSVFVAWLIILLGAQIAYAWQNVEGYRREYLNPETTSGFHDACGVRLMLRMARDFIDGGRPLDYEKMAEEWEWPNRVLRNVLDRLALCGLVIKIGERSTEYVPGKPLSQITLRQVLEALRHGPRGPVMVVKGADKDRVNSALKDLAASEGGSRMDQSLERIVQGG